MERLRRSHGRVGERLGWGPKRSIRRPDQTLAILIARQAFEDEFFCECFKLLVIYIKLELEGAIRDTLFEYKQTYRLA
jgi:hypothetical protein